MLATNEPNEDTINLNNVRFSMHDLRRGSCEVSMTCSMSATVGVWGNEGTCVTWHRGSLALPQYPVTF